MDPLSITFGTIGTLGVLLHSTRRLIEFVSDVKGAPKEVTIAIREVESFQSIVQRVDEYRKGGQISAELALELDNPVRYCAESVRTLANELRRHIEANGSQYSWKSMRWAFSGKKKVEGIVATLNNNKSSLSTAIDVLVTLKNSSQAESIRNVTEATHSLVLASEENSETRANATNSKIDDMSRQMEELTKAIRDKAPETKADDMVKLLAQLEGQDHAETLRKYFEESTIIEGESLHTDVANLDSLREDFMISDDLDEIEQQFGESVEERLVSYGADNDKNAALLRAITVGDKDAASTLLSSGAQRETKDSAGRTALIVAATEDHRTIGRLLLETGADLNAGDHTGRTALHAAVSCGFSAFVAMLVRAGANLEARTLEGRTPLHEAINAQRPHILQQLLDCKASLEARDSSGQSPLHMAIAQGVAGLPTLRPILAAGVDINSWNLDTGRTALHTVAASGSREVAALLIDSGADMNAVDDKSDTPVLIATNHANDSVLQVLVERGASLDATNNDETALELAAGMDNSNAVEILIKGGAFADAATGPFGQTALMKAVEKSNTAAIEKLVKHANLTLRNKEGLTAFHKASELGLSDILQLLLNACPDFDLDTSDDKGQRCLHYAACSDSVPTTKLLLEMKSDVNAKTTKGLTPLHLAAQFGKVGNARALQEHGADLEIAAEGDYKYTPFLLAAFKNEMAVAQFLIECGADTTAVTINGYTALHLAAFAGHKDMAGFIYDKNSKLAVMHDTYGMTPLHRAAWCNKDDVVRLLLVKGSDVMALDTKTQASALSYLIRKATRSLSLVEYMIDLGADVNHKDSAACPIICYAAQNGLVNIIKLMVRKGADINSANATGQIALDLASTFGHDSTVEYLIEQGCDVEHRDQWSMTPLIRASLNGRESTAKILMKNGASINATSHVQQGPLHFAAGYGKEKLVKLFLEEGADVEHKDVYGFTPILRAAHLGQQSCMERLLESGANIKAVSLRNEDAATLALNQGHRVLAKWILENDKFSQDLSIHKAAAIGNTQTLKLLLDKQPERINEKDVDGQTALHKACAGDKAPAVELLCDRGAEIDAVDEEGLTPLIFASKKGFTEVVRTLLSKGADVSRADPRGYSSLHFGAILTQTRVSELLLDHGANIEQKSHQDETPLHSAAAHGTEGNVRLFIQRKANLDAQMLPNKTTPVTKAISNAHVTSAKALIEAGCDILCRESQTMLTPLMCAAIKTNGAILINLLVDRGAKLEERDAQGATPLDIAAFNDRKEVFTALLERGADVNSANTNGWTAVMRAVRWARESGTRMLLNAGADVSPRIHGSELTSLHLAAINHTGTSIAQMLLDHGADLESRDSQGFTPLIRAAIGNRGVVLEFFVEKGANIEAESTEGLTALLNAAKHFNAPRVKLLLDNGADINARERLNGMKPIHMAARHNSALDVTTLLLEQGAQVNDLAARNETPLLYAAIAGKTPFVKELLSRGADVNLTPIDNAGSPLLRAIKEQHEETAIALLEAGAECNAIDNWGWRTMHYAIKHSLHKLVMRMLEMGASPNMLVERGSELPGDSGQTPLHTALKEGAPVEVVRALLDHGADIHAITTKNKDNALSLLTDPRPTSSVPKTVPEMTALLDLMLERGADLNRRNKVGNTLISIAAYWGNIEMIQILLDRGDNLNFRINNGQTLLHRAMYTAKIESVEFLMEKGLDPVETDKGGLTCMAVAITNARLEIVRMFLKKVKSPGLMKASNAGKTPSQLAREALTEQKNKKPPDETKISNLLEIIKLILDHQGGSSERRLSSTRSTVPVTVKSW